MFGVSTYCLHSVTLESALEQLIPVTSYVEIMDDGLHHVEDAEILRQYPFRYSIHAPSRGTNIASLLEPIRKASVEVMAQCFSVAAEVGGSVVLHPGYFAWEEEREQAKLQLALSLMELHAHARQYGISFFIENMGNWEYFLLKTPSELPLIGMSLFALDVGHAHQNHCLDQFLTIPAQHYHLHDNDGIEDSHAAVGKGTIKFGPVMAAVKKAGIVPVIEIGTLPGVISSISCLESI